MIPGHMGFFCCLCFWYGYKKFGLNTGCATKPEPVVRKDAGGSGSRFRSGVWGECSLGPLKQSRLDQSTGCVGQDEPENGWGASSYGWLSFARVCVPGNTQSIPPGYVKMFLVIRWVTWEGRVSRKRSASLARGCGVSRVEGFRVLECRSKIAFM